MTQHFSLLDKTLPQNDIQYSFSNTETNDTKYNVYKPEMAWNMYDQLQPKKTLAKRN